MLRMLKANLRWISRSSPGGVKDSHSLNTIETGDKRRGSMGYLAHKGLVNNLSIKLNTESIHFLYLLAVAE